jgi:uncharacterized protein (DUF2236 family)
VSQHDESRRLFPRRTVIHRVTSEPAMFLGAGRALMLQVAHPAVGQGVHDHSDFQRDPFSRLLGTLEAVNAVVYGPWDLALEMGRTIQRVHEHVTGADYRANDPANLAWVQATLTDSALWAYEALVGDLGAERADTFCAQMARVGEVFGCPLDVQPQTRAELARYMEEMIASFPVSDASRAVAADIVRPRLAAPLRLPLAPLAAAHGLIAVGATPAPVRELLGLSWDRRRQLLFDRVMAAGRGVNRATPRAVRLAPGQLNDRFLTARARRHLRMPDAA